MKMKLAVTTLLLSCAAAAQVNFNTELTLELERLQAVSRISTTADDPGADATCKRKYRELLNKRVIKVSYGLGYGDSTPGNLVWDDLSFNALYRHLRLPCGPGVTVCGFTPDRRDPRLLRKLVRNLTGGNDHIVEIRLTKPSLSRDNTSNTTGTNLAFQTLTCAGATTKFMREVEEGADLVFYNGHSRNGGGPDFCPARLTADSKHVDYPWYQANRPGISMLTNSLRKAIANGQPNNVVGMFSCSSQLHFERRLRAAAPNAGLILTKRLLSFKETLLDSFAALDGILAQRCGDGFEVSFGHRNATRWVNMFSTPARRRDKSIDRATEARATMEFLKAQAELTESLAAEASGSLIEGYEPVTEP